MQGREERVLLCGGPTVTARDLLMSSTERQGNMAVWGLVRRVGRVSLCTGALENKKG